MTAAEAIREARCLTPTWCIHRPYGWCACVSKPRGEKPRILSKRRAMCGRAVMFSGHYEFRTPTCPACRRKLLAQYISEHYDGRCHSIS